MTNNHPIAVFDSGLGGLSVLREIMAILPLEPVRYLADSRNCPYGSRPVEETTALARAHIEFLLSLSCKLVVVACNTITAAAIDILRREYSVPFIGMEPALKPACRQTRTGRIGILATENTFNGKLFQQTYEKYAKGIQVYVQPGYGLVELVEANEHRSRKAYELMKKYLAPMMENGVDTLVLGCTHYPFLTPVIRDITGDTVHIIDPAGAVAVQTCRVLKESGLMSGNRIPPDHILFTSGSPHTARTVLSSITDRPFDVVTLDIYPAGQPALCR